MSNSTEPVNSNLEEVTPAFFKSKFDNSLSYIEYKDLVLSLAANKDTTGDNKSEGRIFNTKLNSVRMNRLDKTIVILPGITKALLNLKKELVWLVLTESWCGDSAQNLPAINKIAELSDKIHLGFVFRDDNPELMDCCLTNGTRSIPKVICVNKEDYSLLGTWGPRPDPAQAMMREYKEKKHKEYDEVQQDIAIWYTNDKCVTIQNEFIALIKDWENS